MLEVHASLQATEPTGGAQVVEVGLVVNLQALEVGSHDHLSFAAVHKSFLAFGSQGELQTKTAASQLTEVGFAVSLHLLEF